MTRMSPDGSEALRNRRDPKRKVVVSTVIR